MAEETKEELKKRLVKERAIRVKKKKEIKKRAKVFFDSVPEESVEGFDNFFVGAQAEDLMNRSFNRRIHKFQGMAYEGAEVEMIDDLEDFHFSSGRSDSGDLIALFRGVKKEIFDKFDFIKLKSQQFDHPVREEDLVVTEDDHHLIAYLVTMEVDDFAVKSVASLVAFRDMGVLEAKFIDKCGCPLCEAFNGNFFTIADTLEILCNGRQLVHKGCDCEWLPIIDRLQEWPMKLDEDRWSPVSTCVAYNVPIEMKDHLCSVVSELGVVHFVNMHKFIETHEVDISAGFPVVVLATFTTTGKPKVAKHCYVHNNYINGFGPVDFLKAFLEEQPLEEVVDKEVFIFKGRKVYSKDGFYVDVETGKIL